jgi:hypothetical protein
MMKQEIDAALTSPEKVRDEMRKRFLDRNRRAVKRRSAPRWTTKRAPEAGGDVIVNSKEEYDKLPSGTNIH